jgi:hypothetical protein
MINDREAKTEAASSVPGIRAGEERRKSERFLLRDVQGIMSWDGESGPESCEVRVINISGGGAAVLAEHTPPAGASLRLRLHCDVARMEPVEARTVTTAPHASGNQVIRLRFARWMSLDALLERHRERRLWERYPARESRATLTWMDGSSQRTIRGDLLNISGGGAAIVTEVAPPSGSPIWLQLDASVRLLDPIKPVKSKLVMSSDDPSGMKVAHIQFLDPCPMELFELAVNGKA